MAASNLGVSVRSTSACSEKIVSYLNCSCAMCSIKGVTVVVRRMVIGDEERCRTSRDPGALSHVS